MTYQKSYQKKKQRIANSPTQPARNFFLLAKEMPEMPPSTKNKNKVGCFKKEMTDVVDVQTTWFWTKVSTIATI